MPPRKSTSLVLCPPFPDWNDWAPPELKNRLPFRPTVRGMEQLTDPNEWGMISNNDHACITSTNPKEPGYPPRKLLKCGKRNWSLCGGRKERKIIGPGCASGPGGEAWLEDFMKRLENMGGPAVFLGLHYYGPDGAAAIQYFETIYQKNPKYPAVVSEIASISRNKKEVFAVTSQVANWMDPCPWVFENSRFFIIIILELIF